MEVLCPAWPSPQYSRFSDGVYLLPLNVHSSALNFDLILKDWVYVVDGPRGPSCSLHVDQTLENLPPDFRVLTSVSLELLC